jgi:hypothetical protein
MEKILRSAPVFRKLGLLAASLLFAAAVTGASHPVQAACHNWTEYYTYYSDSTHATQVGWCEFDCYCVTYCEGTRTSYYNHSIWNGCL